MDKSNPSPPFSVRLLSRLGGFYLPFMQCLALICSFLSAITGFFYIVLIIRLNNTYLNIIPTIISASILGTIIIVTVYTSATTSKARSRLNYLLRGKVFKKHTTPHDQELSAWNEIHTLPKRIVIVTTCLIIFFTIIPIYFYDYSIANLNHTTSIQIIIGLIVFGIGTIVTNYLLLEIILVPVRLFLIPSDQVSLSSLRFSNLQFRLSSVVIALILTSILLFGGLSYQLSESKLISDTLLESEVINGKIGLFGLAGLYLLYGIFIIFLMVRTIQFPLSELKHTLTQILTGDLSVRAKILSSDDISQLSLLSNDLLNKLQAAQQNLEIQVQEKTFKLNERVNRLQASARLAKETSDARDLQSLLARTVDLISNEIGYFHAGIYLLDTNAEYAILQAASSEGGRKMIARGYKVEIGPNCYVGIAAHQNRPYFVSDVGKDPYFRENPDLPTIQSQIAIPLSSRGKVIGILDIQSEDLIVLQPDDMELLQSLGDQIALAILNVQLIEENQFTLSQMEAVLSENVRRSWGEYSTRKKRAYRYTPTSLSPINQDDKKEALKDTNVAQLLVPINLRGQKIGSINIERKGGKSWNETDKSLAIEVANQVALALENSRLLEETQERAQLEQSLSELTAKLGSSIDTESLLSTAVKEFHKLPDVTDVSILLSPPGTSISKEEI